MRWLGRWFWTPVRENENSAQTIVRVLGNLFRTSITLLFIGGAGLVGAAFISNAASQDHYEEEQKRIEGLNVIVRPLKNTELRKDAVIKLAQFRRAEESGDERTALELGRELAKLYSSEAGFELRCDEDYPIGIYIANKSDKVLASATIELSARNPGSSANALSYLDRSVLWNDYVAPGHALANCFRVGDSNRFLVYSASVRSFDVSFVDLTRQIEEETRSWPISE